jgi:hypothetical protein
MKHIFFLVLTTLAFIGCNTAEKPQKHTMFCYIRYDEAAKSVKAEASLQDVDKKISIEIPGGIRYQGTEMTLTPVYGMTYHHEYSAAFLAEHVFEWRDKKNVKQLFSMNLDPVPEFDLGGKNISVAKGTALVWEGTPLGKGETMVLMWENTTAGLTVPMEVSTSSGRPVIDIPAAKMKDIAPGDWTLYLVRKKLTKTMVADIPVNGILEYYTKTISVRVTK